MTIYYCWVIQGSLNFVWTGNISRIVIEESFNVEINTRRQLCALEINKWDSGLKDTWRWKLTLTFISLVTTRELLKLAQPWFAHCKNVYVRKYAGEVCVKTLAGVSPSRISGPVACLFLLTAEVTWSLPMILKLKVMSHLSKYPLFGTIY